MSDEVLPRRLRWATLAGSSGAPMGLRTATVLAELLDEVDDLSQPLEV